MAEVSDSIHLRRFCRIALTERVPCESTVRKLTRRIGADTVNELTREAHQLPGHATHQRDNTLHARQALKPCKARCGFGVCNRPRAGAASGQRRGHWPRATKPSPGSRRRGAD
jgi:hypothetical protein